MKADLYPCWFQRIPVQYWPSSPIKSGSRFYTAVGLGYLLLVILFLLWEWVAISILAVPSVIEDYHFGSAAMLGEGGPAYASAELYTRSSLQSVLFLVPLVSLFMLVVVKNNAFYRAIAWVAFLIMLLIDVLKN
jgi:hypothetical protein